MEESPTREAFLAHEKSPTSKWCCGLWSGAMLSCLMLESNKQARSSGLNWGGV